MTTYDNIIKKIDRLLIEQISGTTTTGDVEQNTARGKVDVIGGKCPEGMVYDKKKKTCVPKKNETSVVGGSYIDNNTVNIIGSSQTRVVGSKRNSSMPDLDRKEKKKLSLRFNNILGAYVPSQWLENDNTED